MENIIGQCYLSPKNNKKVKVLKQYGNVVLCLDLDNPTTIFWHREIPNKYVIRISSLKKYEAKQIQKTLF